MATSTRTIRAADPIWAALDAKAQKDGLSANALAADILSRELLGFADEEAAPRARPKARKVPAGAVAVEVPRKERDTSPKLAPNDPADVAKGGGIVSGLALPVGNVRAPYQKGQGAKRAKG